MSLRKRESDKRIEHIVDKLKGRYGTGSYSQDPFKALIYTILSQRTRDENTAEAGERLFSVFPTPETIAKAEEQEIIELIKPAGFYKVKAGRIKQVSVIIMENRGRVPDSLEGLLKLPGVGRKTANCVLVYGFGKKAIPVDTHVHRISNRAGIVETKPPEETEKALMEKVPEKFWMAVNELFVKHGKAICRPVNPRCMACDILQLCKSGQDAFRKDGLEKA